VNRDKNNNYTRLKVKMKTARDKAKKKYLERIWEKKMELQRIVQEDKGTRLERELHDSNQWHQNLLRGYDSISESSTENWEKYITGLYDRAMKGSRR